MISISRITYTGIDKQLFMYKYLCTSIASKQRCVLNFIYIKNITKQFKIPENHNNTRDSYFVDK